MAETNEIVEIGNFHPQKKDSEVAKSELEPVEQTDGDNGEDKTVKVDDDPKDSSAVIDVVENEQDEYSYLQREGFTSEIFKIEIKNLKNKISPPMLKKFIAHKDLKTKKIKLLKLKYEVRAYVAFSCEEDREKAIEVLHGIQWKGCTLSVKKAAPKADPLQLKKKATESTSDEPAAKRAKTDDDVSPEEKLKNSVIPLWKMPYEKQVEMKYDNMKQVIRKLGRLIDQNNKQFCKRFMKERKKNQGLCCPLQPMIESPIQEGYRNKCEFTIGRSLDGAERIVGFRFGKYRGGNSSVGGIECCRNVPVKMQEIVKQLQDFVQSSPYDIFDPENSRGHWRLLTLRTTVHGHAAAMIDFHPQQLSDEDLDAVRSSLKKHFSEQETGVTSLYFHINREKTTAANDLQPYELLLGRDDMIEILSGVKFRISPLAFFQINTPAAEVLYSQVRNLCSAGPETTILDVCCGTGTIGLTMAKNVKKVIGIEMVQSAVQDAIVNAKNNDIHNVEFICGKAEDVVPNLLDTLDAENVVAVVDPPRAGLHIKVVQTLRKCEKLKTIVYVSCNPQAAMNNFVDLCRLESKRMKGSNFVPVKAVAVDMFPDTPHCELIILFERYNPDRHLYETDQSTSKVDCQSTVEVEPMAIVETSEKLSPGVLEPDPSQDEPNGQ